MGVTMRPGKDSFTRALIFALEALVEERSDGRFTTVELLNKIKEAPHFPNDQNPILVDREKKFSTGRIMLHPLQGKGSNGHVSRKKAAGLDPLKGHTLTLHFDFSEKPSPTYVETFGRALNDVFARNVSVNRVRWGGMRQATIAGRIAKTFQNRLRRYRRQSLRLQQANSSDSFFDTRLAQSPLDPLTPSSSEQHSPRTTEPAAQGRPYSDSADKSIISLLKPLDSYDESEGHLEDNREGRKRRRCALDSESSS